MPRKRLSVRAGEVLKTQIALDKKMHEEMKHLCKCFKPCGPITVQLIKDTKKGDNYYIEINPRFGGGAPLSMKSGANSAIFILQLLSGKTPNFKLDEVADGAIFSRFDQSICTNIKAYNGKLKGVIFDLDDTLYSEKEYVRSGFKAVAEYLDQPEAFSQLWNSFLCGKQAIDEYLLSIGKMELKENCLKIYRNNIPVIKLYDDMYERLQNYRKQGLKIGIITDGRPEGQRQKIKALHLEDLVDDIIITDELGGEQFRKPCDIAFRILLTKWRIQASETLYIGDNMAKDFQACKQLGIRYEWKENKNGLYWGINENTNFD